MIVYLKNDLLDRIMSTDHETFVIVPIYVNGFIQDSTIRKLAQIEPSIQASIRMSKDVMPYVLLPEWDTQIVFIRCLYPTLSGDCIHMKTFEDYFYKIMEGLVKNCEGEPPVYFVEPFLDNDNLQMNILDIVEECSTKNLVDLVYCNCHLIL